MKKSWMKNNRGAALISIMIAVAFISILASALLYLSYSNYKMKVVNYESKANFYGTEHDLTVLSTTIRNDITKSTTPVDTLESMVGYVELDPDTGNGRYNPHNLAAIVYPSYDATQDADGNDSDATIMLGDGREYGAATSDYKLNISTNITDGSVANYLVEKEGSVDKITLKGVVIEQYTQEGQYVNKITTDMVFRVKQTVNNDGAGGVGEFSMLTDSPAACGGGDGTRIEMYGNVFFGPEDADDALAGVQYTYIDGTDTIDPSGANSLHLKGSSTFVSYGDYMVTFGNIVLEDHAILMVVGGNLTVYGDIILKGNSALICTGSLYFPECEKPGETSGTPEAKYGINTSAGIAGNVVIKDGVKTVSQANYDSVIAELKLNDNIRTNDGILPNILSATAMADLQQCKTIGGANDLLTEEVDFYGKKYSSVIWQQEAAINASQAGGMLCFLNIDATIGDSTDARQNLDTTIISLYDINFSNAKVLRYSQIGSDTFRYLTLKSGESLTNTAYTFNDDAHKLYVENKKTDSAYSDINGMVLGDFFNDDPDTVVNTVLGLSTNGTGSEPVVMSAVGYSNWVKE